MTTTQAPPLAPLLRPKTITATNPPAFLNNNNDSNNKKGNS